VKELEHAGLVYATREGRCIRYRIQADQVAQLMEFLLSDCCQGRPDLCTPQAPLPSLTQTQTQTQTQTPTGEA
jgi:hypothetical protein